MTRITIPALFLRPYSVLEMISARMIGNIDKIENIASLDNPVDRMKTVATWLLISARPENFNHKPYNPIIGEEHKAKFQFNDGAHLFLIAEQVRHHPPISAFHGVIPDKRVSIEGNSNFSVTFNGNSVTVSMLGEMRIKVKLSNGEEEVYQLSKCVPDIHIQNVIFGTKYVAWSGGIQIECKQSGIAGSVDFVPTSKGYNDVTGSVFKRENGKENVIFYIKGSTGKKMNIFKDKKMKEVLETIVDYTNIHINVPEYPSMDDMPPNASIKLWKEVTKAIIDNDMTIADQKKGEIEQEQRDKLSNGNITEPKYFRELRENVWEVIDPEWYKSSPDINPDAKRD